MQQLNYNEFSTRIRGARNVNWRWSPDRIDIDGYDYEWLWRKRWERALGRASVEFNEWQRWDRRL